MISAVGWGTPVSHIGWSRPIDEIRTFIREHDFGWVLGDAPQEEGEEEGIADGAD